MVSLQNIHWDLEGINILLDSIIDKTESGIAGGIFEKLTAVDHMAKLPLSGKELLLVLLLVSNANNFEIHSVRHAFFESPVREKS